MVLDLLRNLPKDKFDFTLLLNLYQGELVTEIPKDIKLIVVEKGREQMSKNPFIQKIQLGLRRLKLEIYDKFPSILYALKVKENFDENGNLKKREEGSNELFKQIKIFEIISFSDDR